MLKSVGNLPMPLSIGYGIPEVQEFLPLGYQLNKYVIASERDKPGLCLKRIKIHDH